LGLLLFKSPPGPQGAPELLPNVMAVSPVESQLPCEPVPESQAGPAIPSLPLGRCACKPVNWVCEMTHPLAHHMPGSMFRGDPSAKKNILHKDKAKFFSFWQKECR
jgi:hypothetical protein